jgi:hypothetical protein
MPKMLDAALEFARQGIPVFPCRNDDKAPITPHGFKDATTDEKQIKLWWTQYPSAMIGMPTGKASGRWILDSDLDLNKAIDGPKKLAELIAKKGALPKTPTCSTPRGGTHHHFAWTEALGITNSRGALPDGLDVRGEGGYVILPPSVSASGVPYAWINGVGAPANSPTWLLNQINSSPRARKWAKNALEQECATVAQAKPGERNNVLNTAAFNLGQIVGGGSLDEDTVFAALLAAAETCKLVEDDGEQKVRATIESGMMAGTRQPRHRAGNGAQAILPIGTSSPPPSGTPSGSPSSASASAAPSPAPAPAPSPASSSAPATRPRIRLIDGELPRIVTEAEEALIAAKQHFYQHGDLVVKPTKTKLFAAHERDTLAWQLRPVTQPEMVEAFTDVARFEKMDHRVGDFVAKDCPKQVAETYLARQGRWKLPILLGITNTPFLRRDGTICERPGYDLNSALLFNPERQIFPSIPQAPSLEEAREALKYLNDTLLAEFPFVEDVDRSVTLSAILSAFDRRSLATAPLHAFTSPSAGTGKSLLIDLISILLSSQLAPVVAQGKAPEELEKRLATALLYSDQVVSIDNCGRELDNDFLCQALTQRILKIRLLGHNRQVNVPVASIFFATGNNLVISNDLVRRTLLCRLDAKTGRPELRTFNNNVLEQAYSKRIKLVCAVLTILRAWHAPATAVGVTPALGSFEDWSFRIRSPLIWLSATDPVLSMETVYQNDPERMKLSAVLTQWKANLGTTSAYSIQQIINRAALDADFFGALMAVAAATHGNVISNDRLGRYLAKSNGRIIDKLKLEKRGFSSSGYPLWAVKED